MTDEDLGSGARSRLDGLVVNMELTLISIIQGVALYFLTESSRGLIVTLQFTSWPYIAVGLLTIFLFWSRSLIHTFTVIRWPLEFGHNFFYIACTLAEAVMFTQLANLENWFLLGTIYGVMIWFLFLYDLGMINRLLAQQGAERDELCELLRRDQMLNVRIVMPAFVLFHGAAYAALRLRPDIFIGGSWHLVFGGTQILCGVIYLRVVLGFFRRIAPMIARRPASEESL